MTLRPPLLAKQPENEPAWCTPFDRDAVDHANIDQRHCPTKLFVQPSAYTDDIDEQVFVGEDGQDVGHCIWGSG